MTNIILYTEKKKTYKQPQNRCATMTKQQSTKGVRRTQRVRGIRTK